LRDEKKQDPARAGPQLEPEKAREGAGQLQPRTATALNGGRGARHNKCAAPCQQPVRATEAGAAEGVEHGIDAARAPRRTAATRSGASRSNATVPSVVHGPGTRAHWPQPSPGPGKADAARASELQHPVEHMGGDRHLGRAALVHMRAKPVADHLFPSAHSGFDPGVFVVSRRILPRHAPVFGDDLQVAVALGWRGLGRVARHGGRTQRHDHGRLRMALGNAGVNAVLIVGAVARERGHRTRDFTEQRSQRVRHLVPLPRDVAAAVLVQLERKGASGVWGGRSPTSLGSSAPPSDPRTTPAPASNTL